MSESVKPLVSASLPDPQAASAPIVLQVHGHRVAAVNDPHSDRLRCDHPPVDVSPRALADRLVARAEEAGRGRIVALVPAPVGEGLEQEGFALEGVMPGFYRGDEDCAVLGLGLDEERMAPAWADEVARTDALLATNGPGRCHPTVETHRASVGDAPAIASLLNETFADYPTPTTPAYVAEQIVSGTPFRLVRDDGELVACASADLVRTAEAAELTDCATRPSHRGRGLMQSILTDLMGDVSALGYPTVFTLARARIPGVNLAFQRLGFVHRGRMVQSCRIGDGLEDMNIWSRGMA